jgi:PilX N-terminal
MKSMTQRMKANEGSAFVISILVLFVLTVLGLALMLTTTTEKDIAINYRWGEQAFFNADAALEYGKNVLAAYALVNQDFTGILPPARVDATVANDTLVWPAGVPDAAACNPATAGCRDYQYFIDQCPAGGGPCTRVYIGRVLPRPDGSLAMWDFRAPGAMAGDLDNDGAADIEGTATLWIRRPMVGKRDYGTLPNENDRVILTAEGTAPNGQGAGAGKPVSLRRLEMAVRLPSQGVEGSKYDDASNASDDSAAGSTYGTQTAVNP